MQWRIPVIKITGRPRSKNYDEFEDSVYIMSSKTAG